MSRPVISGVIAAVIAMLTAVAYFVTTSSIEKDIERDARLRVAKAQELLVQNSSLEMLGLLKDTEQLAHDTDLLKSLTSGSGPNSRQAELAFQKFRAKLAGDGDKKAQRRPPDIMALTDENGKLVALMSGDKPVFNPIPDTYLKDGKVKYPALARAIEQHQITSEVWDYENLGPMKAGVAPVYDKEIDNIAGTVILAYAMSAVEAKEQQKLLGTDVAYFYGDRVSATSMGPAGSEKKGGKAVAIRNALFEGDKSLAGAALKSESGLSDVVTIDIEGDEYWASAGRMPRFSTQPFPPDYPDAPAGAMVMMSRDAELAPLSTVKVAILLVGLGAIVVALLGMFIAARRILHPLDEIETGVNDIINGNLERTFRPVGSDLDGLANALNVLLARLLGRPEPGEEEYDEEGNVIRPSGLAVDTDGLSQQDAEAVSLAAEPEPQYLRRTYEQYIAARRQTGEGIQGIDYDGFIAKLRQNESVLKGKYQCRAVRFRVDIKDGKVSLKPVPIV